LYWLQLLKQYLGWLLNTVQALFATKKYEKAQLYVGAAASIHPRLDSDFMEVCHIINHNSHIYLGRISTVSLQQLIDEHVKSIDDNIKQLESYLFRGQIPS